MDKAAIRAKARTILKAVKPSMGNYFNSKDMKLVEAALIQAVNETVKAAANKITAGSYYGPQKFREAILSLLIEEGE